MVSLLIDGYNVIGVLHRDIQAERQRFIEALIEYKKQKDHDITVVFDGWKDGGMTESRFVTGGVKVVYSALGEKADAVIKRTVTDHRKQWIIISSDRDIQAHAWAQSAVPVRSEDFSRILERQASEDCPKNDLAPRRKGNPKKPSKKDRAIRRALNKL